MEAKPILRPATLANLRRGTHDLELSLCVLPNFLARRGPRDLRYSLITSVDDLRTQLRLYEKHFYGYRNKRNDDAEGRARAQILRAAATAFLDYISPFATETGIDDSPWPSEVWGYNRDSVLPPLFRWNEGEWGSDFGSFQPLFETKKSLADAAPILIRELETYFTVEYAVSTRKSGAGSSFPSRSKPPPA